MTTSSTNYEPENSAENGRKKLFADRFALRFDKDVPNCPQCGSWETARFPNPKIPAQYACVECDCVFTGLEGADSTNSTNSTHQRDESADDDQNLTPYVRYAPHPTEQAPELTHIDDPVPDDARFASPIYLLTSNQVQRQESLDNPHAVSGNHSIAKALQDECEAKNRVLYPVYAETDAFDDGATYDEARNLLFDFLQDVLDCEPDDCRWFYSGGRSFHAHVPMIITSGSVLKQLKNKAKEWNTESGHDYDVDAGIYTQKRQFRLPGFEHGSGRPKMGFNVMADNLNAELVQAMTDDVCVPNSFDDVLKMVFDYDDSTDLLTIVRGEGRESIYTCERIMRAREANGVSVLKETPLIERDTKPTADHELQRWKQFNRSSFDPTRTNGRRSVCIATVKGGPYCRESNGQRDVLVPAYVSRAISGPGDGSFAITDENCPIRLSSMDIDWSYDPGDTLVIIGYPDNTPTVVIEANELSLWPMHAHIYRTPAIALANTFRTVPGTDARMAVIAFLLLYDVTIPEVNQTASQRTPAPADGGTVDYSSQVMTTAAQYQHKAEEGSIHDLEYGEIRNLGSRLLNNRGWHGAIDWFREQYGSDYDHDMTVKLLGSTADKYYPGMNTPK